jgi:hypothetical protein
VINIENTVKKEKEKYSYVEFIGKDKIFDFFKFFDNLVYNIEIIERHREFIIENKNEDNEVLFTIKKINKIMLK